MSKNALEQVLDTVIRLEETVDGLSETIADHITHCPKIVALIEKVGSLEMSLAEAVAQIEELKVDMQSTTDFFKEQMETFSDELTLFKRAIRTTGSSTENRRVKVPKPKPFAGALNVKELENFLWNMEQYFSDAHIPIEERVIITSMYLFGDAKLWWRTRVDDNLSAGRTPITTWESLMKELKEQFLLCNVAWVARENLRKLKQTGPVRDYVKQFSSLMLDIKNMSEDDKLFNFMSGLQGWAQAELRRQGVKDHLRWLLLRPILYNF
ncbi:hypothetical protein CKAN_00743200 [Cinnamomum micranthum f. kanehirae]|uniref:Retrotransposon gag domain-containing protein n=1 Tax=Cinnamomum micranthum f. kanehirae TaxID=337451 RepID=A0A443NK25_9MAGN|nr:hypothetical protein CKAN_00743200 [Cinnamomum micranthum f. kanehirae]